jgi:hypothetical protein
VLPLNSCNDTGQQNYQLQIKIYLTKSTFNYTDLYNFCELAIAGLFYENIALNLNFIVLFEKQRGSI